jgi:putative NADH-flavin reductase
MKKIALFGGSGKTGQEFLTKALSNGYSVKALARDPGKITQTHENLQVIQGDVLETKSVEKVISETDIVVSLFGHTKGSPEWLQTDGTKNIIAAMNKNGLRKIISLSGGGLPFPEKDQPKFIDKTIRFVMKVFVPKILNDAIEHAKVLRQSNLDWIIVRGPRLTEKEEKGQYRIGWVGVNSGTEIARADLADFILKQVESDEFVKTMPFVSY